MRNVYNNNMTKTDILVDEKFNRIKEVLCNTELRTDNMVVMKTSDEPLNLSLNMEEIKVVATRVQQVQLPTHVRENVREALIYASSYLSASSELGFSGLINKLGNSLQGVFGMYLRNFEDCMEVPQKLVIFSDREDISEVASDIFSQYSEVVVRNSESELFPQDSKTLFINGREICTIPSSCNSETDREGELQSSEGILSPRRSRGQAFKHVTFSPETIENMKNNTFKIDTKYSIVPRQCETGIICDLVPETEHDTLDENNASTE